MMQHYAYPYVIATFDMKMHKLSRLLIQAISASFPKTELGNRWKDEGKAEENVDGDADGDEI